MLKANVGSSTNASAYAAGCEAALAAKQGLEHVKLAFVFAGCQYDLDALLQGVGSVLPGIPLIGNTSHTGVITPAGYISSPDGFVGLMCLEDDTMSVGVAAVKKNIYAREDGKTAAKKAMAAAGRGTPPDYFYMVAPPSEEEYYLKGVSEVIGRKPFFGGSAADNAIAGEWKLMTANGAFADGVAVAFFWSDKPITNLFTGAYHETLDMGIITKVDGDRTLVEIDGVPAVKKYAAWHGLDPAELMGGKLLLATVNSPLGVKDRLGDLIAIRHPMNGNADLSMAVGNKVCPGTAVVRMEASTDELINSAVSTLTALRHKAPPLGALLLVHCGGRRAGIGARIGEVAEGVKKAAGDVPFLMEFTFGEYGYEDDGRNTCGGLMLSYTGFAE